MPPNKGYRLPLVAVRELNEVKKIVLGSSRSKSRRFRRRRVAGGGAGGGQDTQLAVMKSLGVIGKAIDNADGTREPGRSDVPIPVIIQFIWGDDGSTNGLCVNWSLVEIAANRYMICAKDKTDSGWTIIQAFC